MAIAASAVWRVRVAGNVLNGAGYDGTSYPGGTDYTQQDAPQASFAATLSTSAANSTALLNSANTFTSAMVGNAIQIASGTNAIAGFYFVTAFASAGSVTLDRTPATAGALASGTGRLGGAVAALQTCGDSGNATGAKAVPGNVIYVRGSGTDNPATADYTLTNYFTPVSGDTTNGMLRWVSENGRAGIWHVGMFLYNSSLQYLEGFKFAATSTTWQTFGVLACPGCTVINCLFDQNGFDTTHNKYQGCRFIGCEFTNTGSATAGSIAGLGPVSNYGSFYLNCNIHDLKGPGVNLSVGDTFINCLIASNNGNGVIITDASNNALPATMTGCTIDGNAGHGISITSGSNLPSLSIVNNIISNHIGAGKSGISCAGTLAVNDRMQAILDYNTFYNNAANTTGLTAGSHTVTGTDPTYTDRTAQNFAIGTPVKATGLGAFMNHGAGKTAPTSYVDPGAVQRQEPSASSSVLRRPSLNGVG